MAEGDQFRREPHIDKRIAERCIEQPLTQFLQAVGRDLFLVVLGNVTADRADKSTAFIDSKHSAYITKKPEYLEYPKIFATAGERLIIVTENVTRSAAAENAKYLNRYGMELKPNFPDPTSVIPGTTFKIADLLSLTTRVVSRSLMMDCKGCAGPFHRHRPRPTENILQKLSALTVVR